MLRVAPLAAPVSCMMLLSGGSGVTRYSETKPTKAILSTDGLYSWLMRCFCRAVQHTGDGLEPFCVKLVT